MQGLSGPTTAIVSIVGTSACTQNRRSLPGAIGLAAGRLCAGLSFVVEFAGTSGLTAADGSQCECEEEAAITANDDSRPWHGRRVYEAHCMRCHGAEGHGDGPEMANSRQRPRDLASASWRSGADRDAVRRVIDGRNRRQGDARLWPVNSDDSRARLTRRLRALPRDHRPR